jgi:zinc D-Ala-D-Ala carboxypeptidase
MKGKKVIMSEPLSQHFSWEEACITEHRNLDNSIPVQLYKVIKNTAQGMERVRALLNTPVSVNSWYRCRELNIAIGSNPDTTQHAKGEAVDFISPGYGLPLEIVKKLVKYTPLIDYDQLILEHQWVHISFLVPPAKPRNQVLTLLQSKKYASGITDSFGVPVK